MQATALTQRSFPAQCRKFPFGDESKQNKQTQKLLEIQFGSQ